MRHAQLYAAVLLVVGLSGPALAAGGDSVPCVDLGIADAQNGDIYFRPPRGKLIKLNAGQQIKRNEFARGSLWVASALLDKGGSISTAFNIRFTFLSDDDGKRDISNIQVALLNNRQKNSCPHRSVKVYEFYHSDSFARGRDRCLNLRFHNPRGLLQTNDSDSRRSAFKFFPNIKSDDNEVASNLLSLGSVTDFFKNFFPAETQVPASSYKSWIINLTGERPNGTCFRVAPGVPANASQAEIAIRDLRTRESGDLQYEGNLKVMLTDKPQP